MIVGLGIDLIDCARVQRELSRGAWTPEDGIFTASEIGRCNSAGRPAPSFAACFAAKEAALKALGMEVANLSCFRDVELVPLSDHNFILKLTGLAETASRSLGVQRVSVAVATNGTLSGAVVVLES